MSRGGWQYRTPRCPCGQAAIYQGHHGPLCPGCKALEEALDACLAADIEAEESPSPRQRPHGQEEISITGSRNTPSRRNERG